MKKSLLVLLMMSSSVFAGVPADLRINGVFDGTFSGGGPKFVEFYVINDIVNLNHYGFGSANNGSGSDSVEFSFPGVSATAGDFIYVVYSGNDGANLFMNYFGFAANYSTDIAPNVNGNDAIELFNTNAVLRGGNALIDVYGAQNTDGAGEVWEYTNSFAHSKSARAPSTTFTPADWNFEAINILDSCNTGTNGTCSDFYPVNTLPVELMNFSVE